MKYIIVPCLLLTLIINAASLKAQSNQNNFIPVVLPKAPNTASLEKFGTYKVDLFTGLPDISIPLYTIEAGSVKIPISLAYHASGIRVSEVASWVGLGWALSAGGQISRRVVGAPDDAVGGYLMNNLRQSANIDMNVNSDMDYVNNLMNGRTDERPDIYSYQFPGHSGKFFFDGTNNMKVALIPYAPIAITNTTYTGNHSLQPQAIKFTLLDEIGNTYLFGNTNPEITNSGSQSQASTPAISAWPLEQITSQDKKNIVNFQFAQQTINLPQISTDTYVIDDQVYHGNNASSSAYTAGYMLGPSTTPFSQVTEQLIQEIDFTNGKIVFDLDANPRSDINQNGGNLAYALNDIKVYHLNPQTGNFELTKYIVFLKTYFNQGSSDSRLKLDAIQVFDASGTLIEQYHFNYNTSVALPSYYSKAVDFWGYYNGKNNNSLIPQMSVYYSPTGQSGQNITIGSSVPNGRVPDPSFNQAAILKSISYPAGGHTDFTYETNRYLDDDNILQYAGGLRIASIKSYDDVNSAPIIRSYGYDSTRAKKNFILDNVFFTNTQQYRYYEISGQGGNSCPVTTNSEQHRTFVSTPHTELEPFDGSTVNYPFVTEYDGTTDINVGKTSYSYSYASDYTVSASQVGTLVYMTSFYQRGQLLSKGDYKRQADGTYQIVKSVNNSYSAFPAKRFSGIGLVAGQRYTNNGNQQSPIYASSCTRPTDVNNYIYQNYDIVSDDNYLTSSSTTEYDVLDPSKSATSVIQYKYDNVVHQQVSRTYATDSKGNTKVTTVKYPADYLSGGTTGNQVLDAMLAVNMQAGPLEKWDTLKNVVSNTTSVTGAQLNLYKGGSIAGTIVPDQIKALSIASPVTDFQPAVFYYGNPQTDGRYEQLISFDGYDPVNNPVQYKARNASPVTIIWGYGRQYPVAEIRNASYQDVVNVLGQSTIDQLATNSPGNDSQVRNLLNALRTDPRLSNAQVTSYTYSPLVGMTSMTDVKGMTTYYEYDNFQRLISVRDKDGKLIKHSDYHYQNQ